MIIYEARGVGAVVWRLTSRLRQFQFAPCGFRFSSAAQLRNWTFGLISSTLGWSH